MCDTKKVFVAHSTFYIDTKINFVELKKLFFDIIREDIAVKNSNI
jgi:hypothetical protein